MGLVGKLDIFSVRPTSNWQLGSWPRQNADYGASLKRELIAGENSPTHLSSAKNADVPLSSARPGSH